jgi:hypothetical protein
MADTCIATDSRDAWSAPSGQLHNIHQPQVSLDQELERMRSTLKELYRARDNRAIFLRAYYTMSSEVRDALRGEGDFDHPLFFDAEWVDALAAGFSRRYFDSLETPQNSIWKRAHEVARQPRASILESLLLGINAHINFDLAFCVHAIIHERREAESPEQLARRKFDHDQINNVLMHSLPKVQDVLAREFGGGMRFFSQLFGKVDEMLTLTGLRYYRDRVWSNSLGLLAARNEAERKKVELRLEWESRQVADFISEGSLLTQAAWGLDSLLWQWRFTEPQLGGRNTPSARKPLRAGAQKRLHHRLQLPY